MKRSTTRLPKSSPEELQPLAERATSLLTALALGGKVTVEPVPEQADEWLIAAETPHGLYWLFEGAMAQKSLEGTTVTPDRWELHEVTDGASSADLGLYATYDESMLAMCDQAFRRKRDAEYSKLPPLEAGA